MPHCGNPPMGSMRYSKAVRYGLVSSYSNCSQEIKTVPKTCNDLQGETEKNQAQPKRS